MLSVPSPDKRIIQSNRGETEGNIFASFGIDLNTNRGRIRSSTGVLKAINTDDESKLDRFCSQILAYGGSNYAIGEAVVSSTTITGTWNEVSSAPEPDADEDDAIVYDDKLWVTDGTEIKTYDGSWDTNYWTSNLGGHALPSAQKKILKKGPQGDLFIILSGGSVDRLVLPSTTAQGTNGDAGTLDFTANNVTFTCAEMTSSRLWIGFRNDNDGNGGVIEWDMGSTSLTPNRVHPIPAKGVNCIAIWNDAPIAVLSNGKLAQFNGAGFGLMKGFEFPNPEGRYPFSTQGSTFIHNNGWDIIDGLPHFLTANRDDDNLNSRYGAGVWCLDPEIGLYNRFPISSGLSTQKEYGRLSLEAVGALAATPETETDRSSSKFIASVEYQPVNSTAFASKTKKAALLYHDATASQPTRNWFMTSFDEGVDSPWEKIEILHRKLTSGDKIRVYYRHSNDEPVRLDGFWSSTTTFNTTASVDDLEDGNIALLRDGPGAGEWLKIQNIDNNNTSVLTTETNSFASANDAGILEVWDFKFMGEVTNTAVDWSSFDVPSTERARRIQLLVVLERDSANFIELDNVIIT